MDELLANFPTKEAPPSESYRSFIYQPERISINSRQDITSITTPQLQFLDADYYYTFSSPLRVPLLGVKSLELLRASIPNAVPSVPNNEACFYYYKIPADPVNYLPNYNALSAATIRIVRLLPMPPYTPDNYTNPQQYGFNATFDDYQSIVDALNRAAQNDPNAAALAGFYEANDVEFYYDPITNRIGFRGLQYEQGGFPAFYYLPVGYKDTNIAIVQQAVRTVLADPAGTLFPTNGNYTLNKRLGFCWDGIYTLPALPPIPPAPASLGWAVLSARTIPKPNYNGAWNPLLPNYTAETFGDLVNTANIFIYCDIVGGSTQDTNADERLLAVVPTAASNLGVVFGESKLAVPLTKVSQTITQINITLRTDTGSPFYLPKTAYVNLELKLHYE